MVKASSTNILCGGTCIWYHTVIWNEKWAFCQGLFIELEVFWIQCYSCTSSWKKMRNLFETCWCIKIDRFLLKPQLPENITFFKHMYISRDFSEQRYLQLGTILYTYQDWHATIHFSKFSCMFLNPNNLFQFKF